LERVTGETNIKLQLKLDGCGKYDIYTGVGFLDHMLALFSRHGFFDICVNATGDVEVDSHHTVEDVGIVLGEAIRECLGDKKGIKRYGDAIVPMEEALALCAADISGRPYLSFDARFNSGMLGNMETEMVEEFFRAVCVHAGLNVHIKVLAGKNDHHIAEAIFKAFAKAMDAASAYDERVEGVLSSKGMLED